MDILPLETLTVEGLTLPQVQQSLSIQCFGKSFQRKSDVPKKFKAKALNLASDLLKEGIESFVTETNFSYTVWAEKKVTKAPSTPIPSPENKSFTPSPVAYITPRINYTSPSPTDVKYKRKEEAMMTFNPVTINNNSNPELEQKQKGAGVIDSEKNRRMKSKQKTYRGVTYS